MMCQVRTQHSLYVVTKLYVNSELTLLLSAVWFSLHVAALNLARDIAYRKQDLKGY